MKIRIIFLVLFLTVVTITSCGEPHKPVQVYDGPSKELLKHIITLEKATEIFKLYETQRLNILKDSLRNVYKDPNFDDTRMVMFDIKTIKEYITYVEEESKKADVTPTGLRFYFSVYTDRDEEKNHQTFFIAPTKVNGKNQSGYTLDKDGNVVLLKDKLKSHYENSPNQKVEKAGFFTIVQEDEGLLLNGGTGTPPSGN